MGPTRPRDVILCPNGNNSFYQKFIAACFELIDDCGGKVVPTGLTRCRNIDNTASVCKSRLQIRSALLDYCGHDSRDRACRRRGANLISNNA